MVTKVFRSLILAALVAALYVVPATAQTTINYRFWTWRDGTNNNLFDYWTSDFCLGGSQYNITVWKLGSGLQPFFVAPMIHPISSVTGPNNSLLAECRWNSSATYALVPGAQYKITGGYPVSQTTYFTAATAGCSTYCGIGHRLPAGSSGE
jgi:hypothetical protein